MTFDNKRTFGVEIEFIGQNNQRTTNTSLPIFLTFGQVFEQILGQCFEQRFGEGRNH